MSICTDRHCVFRLEAVRSRANHQLTRSLDDCSNQDIDHILEHFGWPSASPAPLQPDFLLIPLAPQIMPLPSFTPPVAPEYSYTSEFSPDGVPKEGLMQSHFGSSILPNSRGVFLKNIPPFVSVVDIIPQIRGGRIERVDFQNHQNRTCVGVFFVLAEHAERYIKYIRRGKGVYWASVGIVSPVEAIPRAKGGHEPIKRNIAKAIREEDATRILIVENIHEGTNVDVLQDQVRKQSANLTVEFESVEIVGRTAVIKMSSIGTALGARLRLGRSKWYEGCTFRWGEDECEGDLGELRMRWEREIK